MKIINHTKNVLITEKLLIPTTLLDQFLGLLKHKKPTAMLFKTRFGIHTFGMHYAIDVLILDKENNVVAMKENMLPNKIFLWNPKYETVLELPTETIKIKKINLGDILKFSK